MVTPGEDSGGDEKERESRRDRRRASREEKTDEKIDRRQVRDERDERHGGGLSAWGPRILAPLAFFLAATILILLVSSALDHKKNESTTTTPANTPTAPVANQGAGTGTVTGKPGRKFYVIKEGDTLEAIAARENTTVDDLIALNPGIEANALVPGKKIRIS